MLLKLILRYFGLVLVVAVAGCADDAMRAGRSENQSGDNLARTTSQTVPQVGTIEPAALFHGPMPTGVAVSSKGRMFVNFPRWGDPIEYTVAEVVEGKEVPYPNLQMQQIQKQKDADTLISVQSVVVDEKDRLWILDTGSIKMGPVKPGGPKLICVDLGTNQITKKIIFPDDVALKTTYLNDVRFDLDRGQEGFAYITDSSSEGPNAIIVVDLASQKAWRRLNDDPSVKATENFAPRVEGELLMKREPNQPAKPIKMGSDGIALDRKQDILYFCPLAGRDLFKIPLDALSDPSMTPDQVAAAVQKLPDRDFASDGLICDSNGTLYLTDYEHNAIRRMEGSNYRIVLSDPRMIWPDSMSIRGSDLYFTANQLNRQPTYHSGQDLRQKPYVVFKAKLNGNNPLAQR
jgi:sugar lactone lactonase YvrE